MWILFRPTEAALEGVAFPIGDVVAELLLL